MQNNLRVDEYDHKPFHMPPTLTFMLLILCSVTAVLFFFILTSVARRTGQSSFTYH